MIRWVPFCPRTSSDVAAEGRGERVTDITRWTCGLWGYGRSLEKRGVGVSFFGDPPKMVGSLWISL